MEQFEQDIRNLTEEITQLLLRKRKDYGDSFERLWDKVGMISVAVRLYDKVMRLLNLLEKHPSNESIEDTFKDIIGYGLLSLREMKKK